MLKLQSDPMSYTPPKISAQVSVRIAVAYKAKAEGIRRCWEETARSRRSEGTDVEQKSTIAHVGRSLLEQKVDDEEIANLTGGSNLPELDDKAAWDELREASRERSR